MSIRNKIFCIFFALLFNSAVNNKIIANDIYEGNSLDDTEEYFIIYNNKVFVRKKQYSSIKSIEKKNFTNTNRKKNDNSVMTDIINFEKNKAIQLASMDKDEAKKKQNQEFLRNEISVYRDRSLSIGRRGLYGKKSGYVYYIPKDGTYKLDTGIRFLVHKGFVYKIEKMFDNEYKSDEFFNTGSISCNVFKFNVIYDLFINNEEYFFKSYQLKLDETVFPDYIKVILFTAVDSSKNTNLYLKNFTKKLKVFYLSTRNEVGCLEDGCYDYLEKSEYVRYKMYMGREPLIKKVSCSSNFFFKVKNENVVEIKKDKINLFDADYRDKK